MKRNKNRIGNYESIKNINIRGNYEWIKDIKEHPFFIAIAIAAGFFTLIGAVWAVKGHIYNELQLPQKEINEAWKVIESRKGQKAEGGRIKALETLVKHQQSIEGTDLSGAALRGIKLENAKLNKIILNEADLSNADMNYAHIDRAELKRSKLGNANMSNADLTGADLRDADLNKSKLTKANMGFTQLEGTRFNGANLDGANLDGATIGCTDVCTDFQGAKNLTVKQITRATGWEQACYDEKIGKQLPTPPQNENCFEK